MILLTKEIFLVLKSIDAIFISSETTSMASETVDERTTFKPHILWRLTIRGTTDEADRYFDETIPCSSQEAAYKLHAELIKQIVDDGSIAQLTTEMFEKAVLNKEEQ